MLLSRVASRTKPRSVLINALVVTGGIAHYKPTSRYLSARCPTGILPNRRSTGNSVSCPSQAEKIPHRTEPNAQQDQGNDLQFESLDQEKRQHHPAQGEWIDLLETHNFC